MEGKKKKLTGRWKREMRKYRWNLIWKVVLVNAVALVAFMAVSLWVRGKANVEIGNYFTDARTSVQDYIISALSDPGLLEAREKLIEKIIIIHDNQTEFPDWLQRLHSSYYLPESVSS